MSAVGTENVDTFRTQSKMALLVGITNYPESSGFSRLHYPVEDVGELATELRKQGYTVRCLVDADATRGIIRKAIREMSATIAPNQGTLLFYFSGHGFEQSNQNYLAVYGTVVDDLEGEGLPLREVVDALNKSPATRKVMFVDACRNDPMTGRQASQRSFAPLSDAEGLRVLYSTRPGGVSYEDQKLGHGVFTYFLIRGFHGYANGHDGWITFGDITNYVLESVKKFGVENGKIQVPFDSGEGSGDFLLARSGKAAEDHAVSRSSLMQADAEAKEGLDLAKAAKYQESVEAFTKAIDARLEASAEEYYFRGLSYLHTQEYQLALDDFSKALEVGGDTAEVYEHRGYSYAALKDSDHAIQDFNKALDLKPDDAVALLNRAKVFLNRSDLDRSLADFNKVIELQSGASIGYRGRASVYLAQRRPDLAIRDLTRAIEVDRSKPDSYIDRGNAFADSGQSAMAFKDYAEAIRLKPDYAPAFERRGWLELEMGEYRRSIEDYTHAIELDATIASAYANRAYARAGLRDYSGAINDCNRAIDRDPYLPEAFNNRGYAQAGVRNYSAALQDYDRAIKLKNDYAAAFENRATVKKAIGDMTGYKSDIEKAKSLKKQQTPIHLTGDRIA